MPLDVEVVREHVHWTAAAAAALRHGIQSMEDQLARYGAADAALFVKAMAEPDGAVDLHARLEVRGRRVIRNVQDLDLAWGVTRLTRQLLEEVDHTFERVTVPLPGDEPWHQLSARVMALAHQEVHRVVDLGDAPAGAIDPEDIAEEVLAGQIREANGEGIRPSWDALCRALRAALENRLAQLSERAGELSLEAPADRFLAEDSPIEEDPYAFFVPDGSTLKNEDIIGGAEPPLSGVRRGP